MSDTPRDLPVNAQDYYELGKARERQRLADKLYERALAYDDGMWWHAETIRHEAHLIESEET